MDNFEFTKMVNDHSDMVALQRKLAAILAKRKKRRKRKA